MITLDEQRERLIDLLRAAVPDHTDAILATARPSLRLFGTEGETATSRFGGDPSLPPDVEWPTHGGRPLVFLLQLDLAEVAKHRVTTELPDHGLLSFFTMGMWMNAEEAEFDAYGSVGKVLWTPSLEGLESRPLPYGTGDDDPIPVSEAAIQMAPELCLPPLEGPDFDPVGLKGTDAHATYWDEVWMDRLAHEDEPYHRLLGHADMNYNYSMAGKRLLLQVDSDDEIGWEFGDYQALRFQIPPSDLAAHNFDAVDCNGDIE